MGTEAQNVTLLQKIYAAYAQKDPRPLIDALDEHANYRSVQPTPALSFAGVERGKQEFIRALAMIAESYDLVRYEVNEYVAQRDTVLALASAAFRHRKSGKLVEAEKADVWHFRDGRIIEFQEFFDSAKVEAVLHAA